MYSHPSLLLPFLPLSFLSSPLLSSPLLSSSLLSSPLLSSPLLSSPLLSLLTQRNVTVHGLTEQAVTGPEEIAHLLIFGESNNSAAVVNACLIVVWIRPATCLLSVCAVASPSHPSEHVANVASSPGPSQILSRSRGGKSGEGLGSKLHHGPEIVDLVSTNRVHVMY